MKALTLWQPHATLCALGEKRIETRSWKTNYRGPLAIHAGLSRETLDMMAEEPFFSVLKKHGYAGNPRKPLLLGAFVGVCDLVDCVQMRHGKFAIGMQSVSVTPMYDEMLTEQELAFGWYEPGRWAWILENARVLKEPISWPGGRSVWDVPESVAERLKTA